jgi:predicted transcriptional regulator
MHGLGPLESAIMTTVWEAGQPLTVQQARERLNYRCSKGNEPAYSTVMTVMTILCRKKLLMRARNLRPGHPRAWWYQARLTREDYLASIIRDALDCSPDPQAVTRQVLPRPRSQRPY